MAKKKSKKLAGKKRVPTIVKKKMQEKKSRRNSLVTSLSVIVLLVALSLFWYFSNKPAGQDDGLFTSRFDAFSCELPEEWISYDLVDTVRFDGTLGESTHPHLFAPKTTDIKGSAQEEPSLTLDADLLRALEENQGKKASAEDTRLKEEIAKQLNVANKQGELIEDFTVITAAIFTPDKTEKDIKKYLGGIGGLDEPAKYVLEELEKNGEKIPGATFGFFELRDGGHPLGIVKTDGTTIIFNGIFSEERIEEVKQFFLSIKAK